MNSKGITYSWQPFECSVSNSIIGPSLLVRRNFALHYLLPNQLKMCTNVNYIFFFRINSSPKTDKHSLLLLLPLARNLSSCRMQTAFKHSIDASINDHKVNIFDKKINLQTIRFEPRILFYMEIDSSKFLGTQIRSYQCICNVFKKKNKTLNT